MASLRRLFFRLLNAIRPRRAEPDSTGSWPHTFACSKTTFSVGACPLKRRGSQRSERSVVSSTPRIAIATLDRSSGSMTSGAMRRMPFARLDEVPALRCSVSRSWRLASARTRQCSALSTRYNGATLSVVIRTAKDLMALTQTVRCKARQLAPAVP